MGQREDMLAALQAAPDTTVEPTVMGVIGSGQPMSLGDTLKAKINGLPPSVSNAIDGYTSVGARATKNAIDLATDPAVVMGPGAGLATAGLNAGATALGIGKGTTRDPISFERNNDAIRPDQPLQTLSPSYTPDVSVNAAPTLDPSYGKTRPVGGAGGGGIGFGGLKGAMDAAHQAQLRAMDEEKNLTSEQGINQAGRVMATSDLQSQEAARQQAEADSQKRIDADAQARHQAMLDKQQTMVDELGTMKVDPKRVFRSADAGTQVSMWVGGILGGMLAGANGGSNTSLDRLDKIIDRDINAQQSEIDNKKSAIAGQNSLLSQQMAITGDQRAAAAATRNMMLEAAKLELQSKAAQLGIPEMRTAADLAVNAIDQKQKAIQAALAEQAYKSALAQAQAAETARRAAEERAWQRSKDVFEMNLKQQGADTERMKVTNGSSEDIQKQVQSLSKDLSDKDLSNGRMAVDNAKRRLLGLKQDEGLPGVGRMADFRNKLKPEGLNVINPVAQLANAVGGLNDDERVSRDDWAKIKLGYQTQVTGSGGSKEQMAEISQAFEGAKSPAEQRNAIAQADDFFARREAAIKAGYDPAAVRVFEARKNDIAPQLPSTVRVAK